MPPTPVLYDYHRASAAYRVRIALNLQGVAYRSVPVNLVTGEQAGAEHRARNPQGFVPMLRTSDGLQLTQSLAIIDWLDRAHPSPRLIPDEPEPRAHVQAMALLVACDVHPLNNLRVLRYLKTELGQEQPAVDAWYAHWIREGLAALEALAAPHAGRFLHGGAPSLADLCLVPQLANARRFAVPLDDFPTLLRADEAMRALEPVAAAAPERVGA